MRMGRWLSRIRGAIGIALTWAFAWSACGAVLARMPGFDSDLPFPILFGALGFLTGAIFAVILIAIERRLSIDRASVARFAVLGAVSGLLYTGIVVAGALYRGDNVWSEFRLFGAPLVISGAISAAGLLMLARKASHWRNLLTQLAADSLTESTVSR